MPEILEITALEDQDMAIRNDDWKLIRAEIQAAMEEHLHPHGWRKAYRVLRELAPFGGIFMVVIGLTAIIVTLGIGLTNRREADARFQGATVQRLDDIEAALRNLRASQSPGPVLTEISNLSQKQFAQSLPALQAVTKLPVSEVKPTSATLHSVAEKLRNTSEESPDYWPTVLQFIQFASSSLSPDVPPPGSPGIRFENNTGVSLGNVSHQRILLSGGELIDSRIENSRVIFTDTPIRMRNVTFINCVFEVPLSVSPSPSLKQTAKDLLASNLTSVTFASL